MSRNSMTRRMFLTLGLAVAFSAAFGASPAAAQTQVASVQVRVIEASNGGRGVAGALSDISGQLRSRFGRRYDTFVLSSNNNLRLQMGAAPRSVPLPNGSAVQVSFVSMAGSSYQLRVSAPGGGSTVTVPPGGIVFVDVGGSGGTAIIVAVGV